MNEKRFKLHIIWYNKEKTEGEAQLTDNGQPLLITDDIVGVRLIKDCLNALHEENVKLRARNKYLATKIQRERNSHMKEHEKWEEEIQKENEAFKKALVELKEIGDYQEGRIKELNDENEHLEFELEKVVEVCRKYGIYKEELQYVLADYDKMLNENGERAIRYKYCVNSR